MNKFKINKFSLDTKNPILFIILFIIMLILLLSVYRYFFKKLYYFNGLIRMEDLKPPDYNLANKKVAICLSGQIRDGYKECLNLIDIFIIKALGCDVFCCFEDCDNTIKEYVQEKLKPKKIKYLGDYNTDEKIKIKHRYLSMFNKIYLSNELKKQYEKENNFIYDYVIRIRPDLVVKQFLPKKIFEKKDNKLYIAITYAGHDLLGFPDTTVISNSKNMDIYSNIFLYYAKNSKNSENICRMPEYLLYNYLKINNFNVVTFKYMSPIYNQLYKNILSPLKQFAYQFPAYFTNNYLSKCVLKI
jgi:hypothetical protein